MKTPVIMLTALSSVEDRIEGLDAEGGRLPAQAVCLCRAGCPDQSAAQKAGAGRP